MNEISIASSLLNSINTIFSSMLASIDNEIYTILDDLIFVNVDIILDNNFSKILGNTGSYGIILICNSLLYGFLLYYGFSLLLSYLTFSQIQRPISFLSKIILCIIAINSVSLIATAAIFTNSAISSGIRNIGESLFNTPICFSSLIQKLNSTIYLNSSDFNLFSFKGIIKSFISIGFVNLTFSYALRYVMIKVFILICPFAILSLSVDKFSWIFKSWLKIFLSLLFLQIIVALILLITFSLEFIENDLFSQIVYIGSIYALIKANSFIRDLMGGLSTDVNFSIGSIKNLFSGGR